MEGCRLPDRHGRRYHERSSLGIPPLHLFDDGYWPTVRTSGGVGGGATYYEAPARYAFIREDQTLRIVDDVILVAKWTEGNQAFPSLLGRNVLRHFRMEIDWFSSAVNLQEPSERDQ